MNGGDQIIAAVVTKESQKAVVGDLPIFVAEDAIQLQQVATAISRITKSMVHELPTGVILLVKH